MLGWLMYASTAFVCSLGLLFIILALVMPMRKPADSSNRIAHLILVWEALKSPHRFVEARDKDGTLMFPYLTEDLGDTIRGRYRKG